MKEEIDIFEASYAESKAWITKEQKRLIALTGTGDLDDLEKQVAVFTEDASRRLLAPGKQLMATDAFSAATFSQKMGFTRFKLSGAAAEGYAAVSAGQQAILLQRNRRDGIIAMPLALKMNPERVESSIGLVAQRLSASDIPGSVDAYSVSQESIIKHSQIETVMASGGTRGPSIEAMRITGTRDTCDYCKGLAGFWTSQLWTIKYFHGGCTCKIITRRS